MTSLDLSEFFTTKDQATDFCARLEAVVKGLFVDKFDVNQMLLEQFGVEKKDKFITLLRNNDIKLDSQANLKDFLGQLIQKAKKLPTVKLSLAFDPSAKNLEAISAWFVLNLNTQVLLEITTDRNLVGGAQISYNGKVRDFSIKTRFDQIIQNG